MSTCDYVLAAVYVRISTESSYGEKLLALIIDGRIEAAVCMAVCTYVHAYASIYTVCISMVTL